MKPDHTTGGRKLDVKKHKRAMKKARKTKTMLEDIKPYKSTLRRRIEAHEARERRENRRAVGLLLLMGVLFLIAAYFETAHLI